MMENSRSYRAYLKSPYKSIKHTTYFEIYDELFSRYQDKNITFVEIGVLGGGSLFMWREFFGPKARIIGVDLNPNARKWEEHGFEIFIGNQSDENFWKTFSRKVGQIDVVLDDGGHSYTEQIVTTEMLLPFINDNGMIVVEDTHTSYMNGFGPHRYSFIQYVKKMFDKINHRFGGLKSGNSDMRVWSVQCFESIVAFHINRKATNRLSEPTSNGGIDDLAKDYRYNVNTLVEMIDKKVPQLIFLKRIPGVWNFGIKVRGFLVSRTNSSPSIKKYF